MITQRRARSGQATPELKRAPGHGHRRSGRLGRPLKTGGRITILAALFAILPACGTNASTDSTTTGPQETTPPTVTTTGSAGETTFGWVRSFEDTDGSITVGVDPAEMLTGEAAVAAAREDGEIGQDEDLPNDFYIRNPEGSTIEFTISPQVVVTLQACYQGGDCVVTEQVDLATWSVLLGAEEDPGLEWDWYGGGSLPYEFTVVNEMVTGIREMYLP